MNSTQLHSPEKTDTIIAVYSEFHARLRSDESLEQKISFAVSGLSLGFGVLVLRRDFGPTALTQFCIILGFLFTVGIIASWFLWKNIQEMKESCQNIVGFERAMGLYKPDLFLEGKTLLPPELQEWGRKGINSAPYVVGVWISIVAAGIVLGFSFHGDNNASTAKNPDPVRLASPLLPAHLDIEIHGNNYLEQQTMTTINGSLQQLNKVIDTIGLEQKSLDALNITFQQLIKSVDTLGPAVNSLANQQAHPKPPTITNNRNALARHRPGPGK